MSEGRRSSFAVALSRSHFIAGGACLPVAIGLSTASGSTLPTLRFGLTPIFLNNDIQLLDTLKVYLEAATGHSVELVTRRTYLEVTSLLVSGQLDAARICGYPYLQYRDDLELVAIPAWIGKP